MNLDVGSGGGHYQWIPRANICLSYDIPRFRVKEDMIKGDAHHLPFRTKQFETVYAFNVLEHVADPWKVITELKRVGKKVQIRQDRIFNIGSYATPEHLWFQLPNLKFIPYPRTKLGIMFSKGLRMLIMRSIPRLPRHHQISRIIGLFLPPNFQYEVSL